MKLKDFFRMATANMLYWLIMVTVALICALVITLVLMSWVVTIAVVFELILPLRTTAVLVGLTALTLLLLLNIIGKRR